MLQIITNKGGYFTIKSEYDNGCSPVRGTIGKIRSNNADT